MIPFKPKKKKCRNTECRSEFIAQRPMQVACGIPCAMALTRKANERKRAEQAKKERADTRAAKAKIKRRGDYVKDAQEAFNAFIRERDHNEPCISCGRYHTGQYHAGHYRTVGSHPELRFDERNCHKQCAPCNNQRPLRGGCPPIRWRNGLSIGTGPKHPMESNHGTVYRA